MDASAARNRGKPGRAPSGRNGWETRPERYSSINSPVVANASFTATPPATSFWKDCALPAKSML